MSLVDKGVIIIGKLIGVVSRWVGVGAGATWPGEIALNLNPSILQPLVASLKHGVILVAGTNGKTTTSLMIKTILEHAGQSVIHNGSGANLLNGVVSAFIRQASWLGTIEADWGVFEVDENSLPFVLAKCKVQPLDYFDRAQDKSAQGKSAKCKILIVLLNLFRDQLDRYGEVDVIAEKWGNSLGKLTKDTGVILNSDDPLITYLGKKLKTKVYYFGVDEPSLYLKKMEHATDSIFCLNCGHRLNYQGIYYSHVGLWYCQKCGEKRPTPQLSKWKSPLPGLYNLYNTLAAVSVAKELKISDTVINQALSDFAPAFGRQEEFNYDGRKVKIFLAKNPAGFNASLRTVLEFNPKTILLVLNDRIPDGRDVSWIWDVDFEMLPGNIKVIVSGDRVYDMALRIKYTQVSQNLIVEPRLKRAVRAGLSAINKNETLYILPTYSAMLEVRKILGGRKIL